MTNMCEDDPDYTSGDEALVAFHFPIGHASCQRALNIHLDKNETFSNNYYLDMEADCSRKIWEKGFIHPTPSERLTDPIWMETVDGVLDKAGCRTCNGGMISTFVDGKKVWHKLDTTTCTCRVDKYMRWVKTTRESGDGFMFHPDK